MYRYFIEMQFNGEAYCGWQIQPGSPTVQAEVNDKLSILLHEPVKTIGAGRTDTGVHARHFIAHFDSFNDLSSKLPDLTYKLNHILPADVSVQRIIPVAPNAHARFDAVSRTYQYFITTEKNVFQNDQYWQSAYSLDIELMNEGARIIQASNDFASFSKLHSDAKTTICRIKTAFWSKNENTLIFTITADRFLRNMVRAIVGTLVDLGRNKININDLVNIIGYKDRSRAGESVPAKGLFLQKIEYPYPL
jgi:tRNA pseudouridine38-40 synthase